MTRREVTRQTVLQAKSIHALAYGLARTPGTTYTPLEHEKLLTPMEARVMHLLGQGKIRKQIAAEFGISERTLEVHSARVYQKIGTRNRVEFGRWYERNFPTTSPAAPLILGLLYQTTAKASDVPRLLDNLKSQGFDLAFIDPIAWPVEQDTAPTAERAP
jgi:DNA-binding CsgD family transcriptional regulator